jgi:catechol 2,3-dioxygenase-like lactoylglutathione lyase family enzyme
MLTALKAFSGLSVDDMDKARKFYVDTLGLAVSDESMGLQLELPGGGYFFIYHKPDHKPAAYTVLNFVVENIDDTVDHLIGHGISFEHYDNLPVAPDAKEILRGKASGYGPDIAWFKDPAGNTLSVIEE